MVFDELWEGLGLDSITDSEIEDALYDYMVEEGYDEDYTAEEVIEENGEAWYQLFMVI